MTREGPRENSGSGLPDNRSILVNAAKAKLMNGNPDGLPARIVVIEDNPADVLLLREACNLEGLQYEFTTLSDGEEARAFLRRQGKYERVSAPNLILLDMNVPKGDSIEILEEIRRHGEMSAIPVALLSSADAPAPKDRDAIAKATCYLIKPPNLDDFLSLGKQIRSLLENGVPLP